MTAKELREMLYEVTDNTPITIKTESMNPLKVFFGVRSIQKTETITPDGKKSVSMTLLCK